MTRQVFSVSVLSLCHSLRLATHMTRQVFSDSVLSLGDLPRLATHMTRQVFSVYYPLVTCFVWPLTWLDKSFLSLYDPWVTCLVWPPIGLVFPMYYSWVTCLATLRFFGSSVQSPAMFLSKQQIQGKEKRCLNAFYPKTQDSNGGFKLSTPDFP